MDIIEINPTIPEGFDKCISKNQVLKLIAINKLINVAKYLNGDWSPNWSDSKEKKYYIYFYMDKFIDIDLSYCNNTNFVYFKSLDLAQQAIKILGEETIKLALSTNL